MEKKRFSSDELYVLRNEIPVAVLIEKGLDISSHARHGRFCFQCPLCKEFNTAVHLKTNLAKCFRCEEIFNTIDLVMQVRQSDFVDSVRFLKKFYATMTGRTKHHNCRSPMGCMEDARLDKYPQKKETTSSPGPEHIGQILAGIIMPRAAESTDDQSVLSSYSKKSQNPQDHHAGNDRISKLERKVEHLGSQIEKIVKLMDQNPPSR
jgi:hypothetical protein